MWYLHGPDRSVPYDITMKAVDDLYREGLFKRFGISNYMAFVQTLPCKYIRFTEQSADGRSQK